VTIELLPFLYLLISDHWWGCCRPLGAATFSHAEKDQKERNDEEERKDEIDVDQSPLVGRQVDGSQPQMVRPLVAQNEFRPENGPLQRRLNLIAKHAGNSFGRFLVPVEFAFKYKPEPPYNKLN
jgi:hypothetical protein